MKTQRTLIVEQILKETVGINEDVVILSDFVYHLLVKNNSNSLIKITQSELPELNKIKIKELIINRTPKSEVTYKKNYLDIEKSFIHSDGHYSIVLYLMDIDKETIYHEINHVLQLILKDKVNNIKSMYNIKSVTTSAANFNDVNMEDFIDKLQKSKESEINSLITETYPLIQYINNQDEFITIIKNSNAYLISQELIEYNIIDGFKNCDEFYRGVFFELIPHIRKLYNKNESINSLTDWMKRQIENYNNAYIEPPLTEITEKIMLRYQKYINKQGNKLQHKLFKLYSLIDEK